ncbi:MAG: hypothetical protein K8R21_08705, partial [Leptospira sp.]|nr:hypothetical protein [Leptospira sp.]
MPNVSKIDPIRITIQLKNTPIAQKSFNLPIIFGVTAPTYFLQVLSSTAGLIWKAALTGVRYIEVKYVVSGNNTSLSVTRSGTGISGDPYIITVNIATNGSGAATSTAHAVKLAAEAVANVAGGSKIVDIAEVVSGGEGVVSAFTQAPLTYERYMEI